ncbi:MAG: hypothetical protein KJO01_08035 [Gammaproteobacteria bacterium]|nr:hypothetical protein [Gammaproteobacteria bacterium]NND46993.1 hypothetical protein [Woeseiaceae bacterium]
MIHLEVATPAFVVVATAIVQAVVDIGRIDKESDRPDGEKKQGGSKQSSDKDGQFALPDWRLPYFVPLEHIFDKIGDILNLTR